MRTLMAWRWLCAAAGAAMLLAAPSDAQETPKRGQVLTADIVGAIGVAAEIQIEIVLKRAREAEAELVLFRLDTPGGLVTSTRTIIQAILGSPVPVVTYVAPSGARAASAGTYIIYASHVAAMAPGTHLGAATPIQLGGPPNPTQPQSPQRDKPADEKPKAGMEDKVLNDAIAYIRALAQLRGRNAEWAEKAVREAATLTATDALKQDVIEFVAADTTDLLRQVDGRSVSIGGVSRPLATKDREVVLVPPDWRTRLLGTIADPNIAFILMMIGIYGILFELWSPGVYFPGVLGGICLLLGLAALSVLPVNFAGLALVLLGVALMVGEAFTPGIGAMGIGGVVSLVIGAAFLFDPDAADIDIRVDWPVIIGTAGLSALLALSVFGYALRSRKRAVVTGAEQMIGMSGRVIAWEGDKGTVRVHGEIWSAAADRSFVPGDEVRVASRTGLTLRIEPI
jgi:membrane-bound serine protease (ClpP class)